MTDRVYPSSKPTGKTKGTTTATTPPNPRLPPPPRKAQIQKPIPNRHPHRPNPIHNQRNPRRRSRRGCFCLCCFWSVLIIILLLLIATVAGCILYLLYHPHRPTFSIAALKISEFNLTTTADDTTRLTSRLNLTISTRNPNKKIIFYYDPIAITCLSDETQIANGSFANPFVSNPNNITIIRSSLYSNSLLLDTETVNHMRSDLKKKSGLPLKILLDTEAQVKIESIKTKKVGIRIKCEGIHSLIPKGGGGKSRNSSSVSAIVSAAKCKLDLRVKIWKWTF
ncbi:NDR1/HIN1-like protein 13 [Cynara cardunculus var. scolymus]|uniref:Late embryogenesis abundant protein, LEA-14 n=1 Tax=Cynara cardunculus var. scolymus TaxID=59895 RepID=A0A118JWX7_CYNCS|nr:NDR1/HIN1-like protein 13 [Cynara cardunculus var. scolymus]KVH95082.1 Late embryogenesis abundant protein, LEA-14 [Cynara cardunculus var. scolymus]